MCLACRIFLAAELTWAPHRRCLAAVKGDASDVYCSMFDLAQVKQLRAADRARLHLVDVDELDQCDTEVSDRYDQLYCRLEAIITDGGYL